MTSPSFSDRIKASERLEKDTLLIFIKQAFEYYKRCWEPVDDSCGFFGELDPKRYNMRSLQFSSPVIEYVVRPHAQILATIAALLKASQNSSELSEKDLMISYLNRGIKWLCRTHLTGDMDVDFFLERKRWGENWNSSLWASTMAIAAFFAKDFLDKETYSDACRVVSFEADRFIDTLPPDGRRGDSKAEETARDTMIIAWAMAMSPEHPHFSEWEHVLKIYALNIASTIYDQGEFYNMEGQAINSYITTVTMHPDYTLESHGFFHPEFLSYTQCVMGTILAFIATDQKIPAFLIRPAHDKVSERFLSCCLSNGYPWPVGAQDWPLWMLKPYSLAYSMWREDRIALKYLLNLLSLLADFQKKTGDGRFVPGMPLTSGGWGLTFESQIGFELAMLYFTPFADDLIIPSAGRFEKAQEDNQNFPYVQTMSRRTGKTFRAFTWNNLHGHPTASIVAQTNPFLTGIAPDNLIGNIEIEGQRILPKVLYHHEETFREGFETSGKITYCNRKQEFLSRELRVYTWAEEGLLIFDRLTALCDLELKKEEACPLYLVNDEITNNRINIISGSLEESIPGPGEHAVDHVMPNSWVVIEDIMLYQIFWGMEKGIIYHDEIEKNETQYWKSIRMDKLFIRPKPGKYEKNQIIRQFGLYVGLGKSPKRFKVNGTPGDFFKGLILIEGKRTMAL